MPCLLGALKNASKDFLGQNTISSQATQPSHILLALKALSTGALEMNDTDFELLESFLKESEKLKDLGMINWCFVFKKCELSFKSMTIILIGSIAVESVKKSRPDLNTALLDQFVSVIPGAMFEKAMTQLTGEGESTNFIRKDHSTQNLVCLN